MNNPLLLSIISDYSLELLIIFGSRATGRNRPDSDTDIAFRSSRNVTRQEELSLAVRLDALYKNVEVCDVRKASPLLLASIGTDGKLLYEKHESLFAEFKIFSWNQYMDFKPQLDLMRERTKREIEEIKGVS